MSIADRLERLPFSGFHYRLLFLGGAGYCFDGLDGAILAFVMPALQHLWGLSMTQLGLLGSGAFFGYFIGALSAGLAADRWGRRSVMMWALACYCVGSLVSALCVSWHGFVLARVVAGLGTGAESAIIAPYLSEFVPRRYRGVFTGALAGFFSFGFVGASLLGYALVPGSANGWRWAVGLTACPVVMLLWWRRALPESPRWLEGVGRGEAAHSVLCGIEKSVGVVPPAYEAGAVASERPSVGGQFARLWSGGLRRVTAMSWVLWLSVTFSYYAFFSWLPTLLIARGFTITHSFGFSIAICVAQIPGYFSAGFCNEYFGRKTTVASYLGAAVLSALAMGIVSTSTGVLMAGMLLSFFMNGTFAGVYAYTPEIFPTALRATGMGSSSAVGRTGAIMAPLLIGALYPRAGFAGVFGLTALILLVGVLSVLIFGPSTVNRSLEEIGEAY
ncbi:MFS transporter [Gluconobacter roseus]|uniref:MFS transporter n=1 Tax=Gluconobacter roseus NBRC 3990 TaxID=1307950 RepID=A0A4Y3M1X4_9PROT|nr:MFS transporter [Gluconobacter roseus]KXV44242.1 MFS transporter [Gluconobacter roseus]GBR44354.1 metabolite transport protein [Gluconobacter roseus NBRC 3990]GEB02593.1 MFS transporter [Gluconobacter roseus NBRC 3990]GLP93053.1 MFS transporter [Gluconobacter roseus NBRC 3990]